MACEGFQPASSHSDRVAVAWHGLLNAELDVSDYSGLSKGAITMSSSNCKRRITGAVAALGATLVHLLSGRSPAELPQRELKLDFGAYVHVTPAFRSWLETLLEPAFERRYPSADAARAALLTPQPANAPQPAAPPLRRPAGTRVEVVHKDDSLYVRIPPGNFTPQTIYLTLFSVIWLSFVAFWTLSASR